MPVVVKLTSAAHGGNGQSSCGDGTHANCGPNCDCGCPYTGMHERGRVEDVRAIEARHPDTWLALVIPPGEDEYQPEQAMLVAYGDDENEVFDAAQSVTFNQVLHVYYNTSLQQYLAWADQ
jgi:hypothetical protein